MPFSIVRDNIVTVPVEAVVNAANSRLKAGGGVCGAIFEAAGKEKLQKECDKIGYCETGDVVITKGYGLQASYIIHAVGPMWRGGQKREEQLLRSCYQKSLQLASQKGINSIAFPIISSGIYGYPKEEALKIAVEEIKKFLEQDEKDMNVVLVVFDKKTFQIGKQRQLKIQEYINDRYVEPFEHQFARRFVEEGEEFYLEPRANISHSTPKSSLKRSYCEMEEETSKVSSKKFLPLRLAKKKTLEDCLNKIEETFSQRLLRMIDESGKKDSEIYKKANIDRKHFSKIRSNPSYTPSKKTVIAFAIALELNLDMVEEQKKYGWEFLFLGANIDAVREASHFGIQEDRAVTYCNDSQGIELNYRVVSETVGRLRRKEKVSRGWKEDIENDVKKRSK